MKDRVKSKPTRNMSAISLFSGCGGDTLGMERCGVRVCAFTEIDPVVREAHLLNFPASELIGSGDMTKITDDEFLAYRDRADIVFAGFPCQGFSNAGKKRTDDQRNSLFYQFVRAVRLIRPKILIGENVKGLLSRDKDGEAYIDLIRKEFRLVGYRIAWRLYDCESLVPQIRQRLIIVGVREDVAIRPEYLLPEPPGTPALDLREILRYSSRGEAVLADDDVDLPTIPEDAYVVQTDGKNNDDDEPPHPYLLLKKDARDCEYDKKHHPNLLSFGKRVSPIHAEIIDRSRPSKTIICTYENQPRLFVPQKRLDGTRTIRCLLVDELKQIQGFPADFRLTGNRKQQIHMIGNAAPPPLVSLIVRHIRERLARPLHPLAPATAAELFGRVFDMFRQRMGSLEQLTRSNGNTQALEKQYTDVFSAVLDGLRLRHTRAGSQKPVDYVVHHPTDPDRDVSVELKRTSGGIVKCNDTFPKEDVYYIIIHEKYGIIWKLGKDLAQPENPNYIEEYKNNIESLHHPKYTKNGNIRTYARPNYDIDITRFFDRSS
jgi:DNA (cytosine-5)-methyltransferase 1